MLWIEAILVGIVIAGIITAIMQIYADKERGIYPKDNGIDPYDYLFRPMPKGSLNPHQPYKRAFAWLGAIICGLGFGWVAANVPNLTILALFYAGLASVTMTVILVEDINPVKADMTACMLWGYGKWEDQILLGILIAIPFVLVGIFAQMFQVEPLQIESMPIASFILTVIMVPLVEEGFFRGVLSATIAEQAGIIHGALVPAFIFAMFHAYVYHLDWFKILIAFIFGSMVAFADFKYKSVLPGTVAHMLVNMVAYLSWLSH